MDFKYLVALCLESRMHCVRKTCPWFNQEVLNWVCFILNFATAQPFVKVRDVIALDPPLSTACQNTHLSGLYNRTSIQEKLSQIPYGAPSSISIYIEYRYTTIVFYCFIVSFTLF